MTELLSDVDAPSDAELISRVRGGDVAAYGDLFARHKDAATRLSRQLVRGPDADDLVSEAFAKVLTVLQGGGGPDVAFRAYLLTAVRRLHVDQIRSGAAPADHRRHDAVRPGRAVPGHRRRGLRERCRRQGVRVAARALAAGAVAPRGGGPEARRHRAAARDERQLGLRARLPRPRGPAPGVLDHAPLRHLRRPTAAGSTSTSARYVRKGLSKRDAAQGRGPPRRVPLVHGDVPRAHRGQLQPRRHHRPAAPRRCRGRLPRLLRRGSARPGCSA